MHRFQRISQPVRRTCSPSRDVKGFGRTPIRYPGSNAERFEHESLGTGPVSVAGYKRDGRPPEEVAMMEKAQTYGAHSVFFEAGGAGAPPLAGALASAGAAGAFAAVASPLAGDAARTKTQSPLPSEDAVLSLLFGLLRRGQVTLRRLVGWQDLNSLKSQAAVWQPGYSNAQLAA